jgi:hypothetical protein
MSKIVAVGDIHHGPNLEQIEAAIEREKPDLTVFIGDYFDQFGDQPEHAYLTAKWLKGSLAKPDRVHLWGNHDLPYWQPAHAWCPGYTPQKLAAIRALMDDSDWARLKLWHIDGGWLFTHAGLSLPYAPADITTLEEFLRAEEKSAWAAMNVFSPHWIWSIGRSRGGPVPCGGLLWCDWAHEFTPVPGLNQVIGHTPGSTLRVMNDSSSENWCIDLTSPTGITHLLVIDGQGARRLQV